MLNVFTALQSIFSTTQEDLGKILLNRGLQVSTAESCTGGLLSSRLTDVDGSSNYVRANFVTYSNEAKEIILEVSSETLKNFGAVSEECAREMAQGLVKKTGCDVAICTTGIAGPTGGTLEKPVGTIYISVYYRGETYVKRFNPNPRLNRRNMKWTFSEEALKMAMKILG